MRSKLLVVGAVLLISGAGVDPAHAACKGKKIKGTNGDDVLKGTCGPDKIIGKGGIDTITGGKGEDKINAGSGDDEIAAGPDNDNVKAGSGADTLVITPTDGSDLLNGQDDLDTIQATGTAGQDIITVAEGGIVGVDVIYGTGTTATVVDGQALSVSVGAGADDVSIGQVAALGIGDVDIDLGVSAAPDTDSDGVSLIGTAGTDVIASSGANPVTVAGLGGPPVDIANPDPDDILTIDGDADLDSIDDTATAMNLVMIGGAGADTLISGIGPDTLLGGTGDDVIVWNPGDGSDVVQGNDGSDRLEFNGSAASEVMAAGVVPFTTRLEFTRNLGNIVMDVNEVETLDVNALGGTDTLNIGDISSTDVSSVITDLQVAGVGDSAADTVNVDGTSSPDVMSVAANGVHVQVTRQGYIVDVLQPEASSDLVRLNGLDGNDNISGSGNLFALSQITMDGGEDDDIVFGTNAADTLIGGEGNDSVDGQQQNDTAFLGDGLDSFTWDPGDGSDVLEGQGGDDTLFFNGSAGGEDFAASLNGGRLQFTRNLGNIVMDTDDVEALAVNALGGTDTFTMNELSGTDISQVNLELGVAGVGDAAADAIILNGTNAQDAMTAFGSFGAVEVNTLGTDLSIGRAEPANDDLTVNILGGNDLFSATGLASSSIDLFLNGGTEDDVLIGSLGDDTINGENGNDFLKGEAGNDTMDCGANTDQADGGSGTGDTAAANCETVVNVP